MLLSTHYSLLIFLFVGSYLTISYGDYIAAVAEHTVYMGIPPDATNNNNATTNEYNLQQNLQSYINLIKLATHHKVQIIVFPEFGLTPTNGKERSDLYPFAEHIPTVITTDRKHERVESTPIIPCHNPLFQDKPILSTISCAAKENNMIVVINMIDWIDCNSKNDKNCPMDGHYQYNTDVIFNEQGELMTKYHKSHEFPPFIGVYDQVPVPTEVTYNASFGIQFGLFICYDILFPNPAKSLRSQGIEHFLYSVAQGKIGEDTIIQEWSKANDAVLLSSNLGSGLKGDCSGILNRGTPLNVEKYHLIGSEYFPNDNILVAAVPV